MTENLNLNLDGAAHTVTIDGAAYNLRAGDDLSIVEFHRLKRQGMRLDALMNADEITEAEETELAALLDTITKRVLEAPDEIHSKLRDTHRLKIVRTFTRLQLASLAPGGATTSEATTGPASSQG